MRIGIVDADLIGRNKHRFPNLACMKISGYHKNKGDSVTLITEYLKEDSSIFQRYYAKYDKIYVSKVFVDTPVPYSILNLSITVYGGTGFFYANAEPLLPEIEHHFPDYHLYDEWIAEKRNEGKATDREFIYYEEYSIGYTTRGCVRQCNFCINQHSTKVEKASDIKEFLDKNRPKICLLDDNILAYENWKEVFEELNNTGKWFEYKQGFDIRALTDEKAKTIVNSNIYINNIYFAFDNIKDKNTIEEKIILWKKHFQKNTHMYVLCGFDEDNKYDNEFWAKDIEDTLERIRICIKYRIFPYIMRYRMYNSSPDPYRGMYINLGSWCNQRNLFSKWSLNEWVNNIQLANEKQLGKKRLYSSKRYLMEYSGKHPEIAYEYFDLKYGVDSESKYEKNKNQSNSSEKKQQKIIFSTKYDKNSIKVIKVDKVNKLKKIVGSSVNKINVKNDNIETTIKEFSNIDIKNVENKVLSKYAEKEIKKGIATYFSAKNLKSISQNSISLIIINFKNDNITENDKELLIFVQKYLKDSGNIFVFNTNLKTFTTTKEFIEKSTSLKFEEVTSFKVVDSGTKIQYFSRYTFKDNSCIEKIFKPKTDKLFLRKDLLNIITQNTTTKDDRALNFFEQSNFVANINSECNPKWISFRKKEKSSTELAIKYIKEQISNQQIPLLDNKNEDIG